MSICAFRSLGVRGHRKRRKIRRRRTEKKMLATAMNASKCARTWRPRLSTVEIGTKREYSSKSSTNHPETTSSNISLDSYKLQSSYPRVRGMEIVKEPRLNKELTDIRNANLKSFRDLDVNEMNLLQWRGLLVPENEPYDKGAFKIQIDFPTEYPFKPPKVVFTTLIYHPNVDEKGSVCLPIIAAENWKPTTKMTQVLGSLIDLVHQPEADNPLRADLALEYLENRDQFLKKAQEFTKQKAEKRPTK